MKKIMNDINPTTDLLMTGGGVDIENTPHGSSSNSFDDETSKSNESNYTILDKYWNWKVDVVLILAVIAINIYFWQ